MSIIFKHILRNIRQNKFRSILVIFSLTVSTMVLFLNLTIKDDLTNMYKSVLQGTFQEYDIQVSPKNTESNQYFNSNDLNLQGVSVANQVNVIFSTGIYSDNNDNIDVNIIGADKEQLIKDNLCVIKEKSADFDLKKDNQIIISSKTAKKHNIKLGDTIEVSIKGGMGKYEVTAFAETKGYFLMEGDYIFVIANDKYVEELNGVSNQTEEVMIDLKNSESAKDAVKILSKNNPEYNVITLVDEDDVNEALSTINQLLMIVLIAVIILNFYVIRNIIKLIMATRMPVVGTFRSIGATKAKMNFILILENVVYGIFGSIFGIIFGILLRQPISSIFINAGDAFDYINLKYDYKISYIIISVCFSILLQITIALSSIIKASRKSIKDTIFNTLSTSAGIKIRKIISGFVLILLSVIMYFINTNYNMLISGIGIICAISGTVMILPIIVMIISKILTFINGKLFGAGAELGTKTLHKSKTTRSSIVLITVVIAIMMVIYMTVLSISDIFTNAENTVEGDLLVSYLQGEEADYEFINDVDGVTDVRFSYYSFNKYKLNGKENEFGVFCGNRTSYKEIDIDKKLAGNLKDDEIVVDEFFAKKNNIKIGDVINIDSEYMKQGNRKYTVKGFMNASKFTTARNMMYVNQEEYFDTYSKTPSQIEIFVNKDEDEMKEILRKKLAGTNAEIVTKNDFIEQQRQSTNSILGMVEMMLGLSVILSIFGLMNNQVIGFIQKKKEYAILYSTSMSKKQIKIMVLFEVLGTFFCGCIIGMGLSMWITQFLEQILFSIGICIGVSIKIKELVSAVGIIFFVLSLTSISPMRKVSKINVVDEIKYE